MALPALPALPALLLERWDAAATAGVLRSSLSEAQNRMLAGELQLIVQFNAGHAQKKRPADQQLLHPPPASSPPATTTPSAFNFTKISRNELLCALSFEDSVRDELPQLAVNDVDDHGELPQHAVLINISPLMRGHSLFVFDLPQVHPQKLTRQYLKNGLSVVHAAQDPYFTLGFNSAGAWSSVNHIHLQAFFTNELNGEQLAFPILRQSRRQLFMHKAIAVCEFPHWPMVCYGVAANDLTSADRFNTVLEVAWTLVDLLQRCGIPHNVLIASDEATCEPLVIVFPRQPQRVNGVGLFSEFEGEATSLAQTLRFAVAEIAGLVVANTAVQFQRFTQEMFAHILSNEISLTQDEAESITADWKRML